MRTSEPNDLNNRHLRNRAVAAARGAAGFDILITGGQIVDVVTGETRFADIGIVGQMIASVHQPGSRSEAETVIDATGKIITPGLIDTHMHVESSMVTPSYYAEAVLARGVTTVVWDPHELGNVHGIDGVKWAIKATADLPLRFVILAPSCVPSAPGLELSGADFGGAELEEILAMPEIGGVAEVMNMRGVIERQERMSDIVQAGLTSGKPVCGHARGLTGSDLNAFMAAGVSSDHELTSSDDLLEKLRAGLSIELRGSHDHLLPEFVEALIVLGHLPQTITLCTDDVFPDDLERNGGLDDVVRRLIRYGLPAQWALRAATLNAAIRLGRNDLGLIATGRRADIAIFDDLGNLCADMVITNGKPVAKNGKLLVNPSHQSTGELTNSVKCSPLKAVDFKVPSDGQSVRVATIDRPRFTQWGEAETIVRDGFVVPPKGSTLISVTHRHGRAAPITRVGYLTNWGSWRGAFCTTVAHDGHNLTVFGGNEDDMAIAANSVISEGGGMAVALGGKLIASLPLPLSGLISDLSLSEISAGFSAIREAMDEVVDWQPPYLIFKACFGATLACNNGPHMTDLGIADVARSAPLESPVLEILT